MRLNRNRRNCESCDGIAADGTREGRKVKAGIRVQTGNLGIEGVLGPPTDKCYGNLPQRR